MSENEFEETTDEKDIQINLDFDDDEAEKGDDSQIGVNLDFDDFESGEEKSTEIHINLEEDNEEVAEQSTKNTKSAAKDEEIAEELEKALEELYDELMLKPGDWYVVHTYSGKETKVKENIDARVTNLNMEDYVFETIAPTEQVVVVRNGKKTYTERAFWPGYVLVRMEMTDESWAAVRHTTAVTGFVGHGNNPVPLDLQEVVNLLAPMIKAKISASDPSPTKIEVADYAVGDIVKVIDGPFEGVSAPIIELNAHAQRVKVTVELMGRDTPIDLTFAQISKLDEH